MPNIAITYTSLQKRDEAEQLALELNLPLIALQPATNQYRYLLVLTPEYIGLQHTKDKKFAPYFVDFLSTRLQYRRKQANLRNELLAKAMGCKPKDKPYIVDATAGWGRDSYLLASLGYSVTLLEKSPILAVLIKDALSRLTLSNPVLAQQMTFVQTDALDWLPHTKPDIVYLDPMFPQRKKSASVKKEMVILQELLLNDGNLQDLLAVALACAKQRVVVKRPRLAQTIGGQRLPHFSLTGKSCRFDIYLTRAG